MKESILNSVSVLRARVNLTQEELADKVGVTRQTIIAIEKGNYVPSLLLAFKIARLFKKPIEHIFTYE
ncbi:MAG: helix-turn-helix transcriptional regulator [Patescibacteria group bacterium]